MRLSKLKATTILFLLVAPLLLVACEEHDKTDSGGVLLFTELTGTFPFRVSVNTTDRLIFDNIQVQSVAANLEGETSELMDVTLETMEVTFTRADGGSRTPTPLVRRLIALVPVNGSADLSLTVMTFEQLRTPPLSDLLFENGGFDSETGRTNIKMNVILRFFGETLGGKDVVSDPRSLTVEFTQ